MPEISPEWTAELKKGSVQLCLLALLAREQKYGFQILKELRDLSDGFFDLKEGTLYPALRRLEERGFLQRHLVEPQEGGGAPPRWAGTSAGTPAAPPTGRRGRRGEGRARRPRAGASRRRSRGGT